MLFVLIFLSSCSHKLRVVLLLLLSLLLLSFCHPFPVPSPDVLSGKVWYVFYWSALDLCFAIHVFVAFVFLMVWDCIWQKKMQSHATPRSSNSQTSHHNKQQPPHRRTRPQEVNCCVEVYLWGNPDFTRLVDVGFHWATSLPYRQRKYIPSLR